MFDIYEELKKLPRKPGVYLMKNAKDEIIYIGKAINLKNRVNQYFQNSKNKSLKVKTMVDFIVEFEYIITDSEMEALILECNLIKKHEPKYNILLKDDKMYPYIKYTSNEDYPEIFVTRKVLKDKAKYYGPFTDVYAVREIVDTINKIWPIRKCMKSFPRDFNKERPCLNFHINQCIAPCKGDVSKEEYMKIIDEAVLFLEGKHDEIIKKMEKEMLIASDNYEYEQAGMIRDKLKSLQVITQKQKMDNVSAESSDVIAFARSHGEGVVLIFFIRNGKVTGREHFFMKDILELSRSEVITQFVKQFYSGTPFIPKEIILQDPLDEDEEEAIVNFLSDIKGSKVSFTVPKKGDKQKIVQLVSKNAVAMFEQFGEKLKREQQRTVGALKELCEVLKLENVSRIEAYDISNTQGFLSVGSMVVFEDGKPKRSDYRKFKIKTVVGANDYASMKEVIERRFNRGIKEQQNIIENNGKFSKFPDLILMDGGKIQINAALEIFKTLDICIPVCGMIKDDKHKTRGIIFNDEEFYFKNNSEAFLLVTRIQDEVHRFAITYHRKLRENNAISSVLDNIEGVGAVRKKALLRHFSSVDKIKNAEISELLEAESINEKVATTIYNYFRKI